MRNKWKDSFKNHAPEMAGNKVGHSNAVHASIYARNFKRAMKLLPEVATQITPVERAALSAPVAIGKNGRPKRKR